MQWKWIKPTSEDNIVKAEGLLGFKFPMDFRNQIFSVNNGYPEKNLFKLPSGEEKVFDHLYSVNDGDISFIVKRNKVDTPKYKNKLVFIASDPFGNGIAYERDTLKLVFYYHETDEIEYLADTWTAFVKTLYTE